MGESRVRLSIEMTVGVDDPVAVAAFLLSERFDAAGNLLIAAAEGPLPRQVRQVVDESLRAAIAERAELTGLALEELSINRAALVSDDGHYELA